MKPMYRTLDLYTHRKFRDASLPLGILWVRVVWQSISLFMIFLYKTSGEYYMDEYIDLKFPLVLSNLILEVVILILLYTRKPPMLNIIRFTTLGVFIYNFLCILFVYYDSDMTMSLIFSGIVTVYFFLSKNISYYFACSVRGIGEYGLCYSFGDKRYYPKYNAMILYHAIESEVFSYITFKSGSLTQRNYKMNQAVDIFNAYLAVACSTMKRPDIVESIITLREKLMKICCWNRSVISANEDSFMNCTYVLRKSYSSNNNALLAIKKLSETICFSCANVDQEELTGGLIMFYESIKSPDFYEDYYNNQLMQNASLYMN